MTKTLSDYYRIPEDTLATNLAENAAGEEGFFRFGDGNICYGRSPSGVSAKVADSELFCTTAKVIRDRHTVELPFDFHEVIDNLRFERYRERMVPGLEVFAASEPVRKLYYFMRSCLPVSVRRHLQKAYFSDWKSIPFPSWPVDFTVDNLHEEFLKLHMQANGISSVPFIWFWPNGSRSCLMMTHDVETVAGRDFTPQLISLDAKYGIKGSYQVIPEKRYSVPDSYVSEIRSQGCEFNVHDLNHDGHLYREREEFVRRARRINGYVQKFGCNGFRAGAMYRRQDWYDVFEFSYDMSVPNVAHLEPMRGGCCTVFPYFIGRILELPLTATQDYSLFHILNDFSIELWKKQLSLILNRNGLMSFITHPDYLIESRARKVYESLLSFLQGMVQRENVWTALPGDIDRWWRARSRMSLQPKAGGWEIVGEGSECARVAFAVLENEKLRYELQ
ncbi:MAG: hypothetical protein JSS69_03785 [Acidobacteria bacterium]|nr:hypothetical protein [Acidobacteriota bacterium]MBS1865015.1 hypothetical protein [Acidobacteriota bacterium]